MFKNDKNRGDVYVIYIKCYIKCLDRKYIKVGKVFGVVGII